jgi:methyltransferase (TIGR00027 family)
MSAVSPDPTAVRTALWRALHVELDAPPHVLEDTVGLRLAAPDEGWQKRPDMAPWTASFRASIVARARFVEDLVAESGAKQYVLLGAGLDTYAQRHPGTVRVFEIDRPETQSWKKKRLIELGLPAPAFVPVDFEEQSWRDELTKHGFDPAQPAVVTALGVSMYLTRDANAQMLREAAQLAPGSTFVTTFILPVALLSPEQAPGIQAAIAGAAANGTPMISFFAPSEMVTFARDQGLTKARHVSSDELGDRYFKGRADGLRPPNGEHVLVATI